MTCKICVTRIVHRKKPNYTFTKQKQLRYIAEHYAELCIIFPRIKFTMRWCKWNQFGIESYSCCTPQHCSRVWAYSSVYWYVVQILLLPVYVSVTPSLFNTAGGYMENEKHMHDDVSRELYIQRM